MQYPGSVSCRLYRRSIPRSILCDSHNSTRLFCQLAPVPRFGRDPILALHFLAWGHRYTFARTRRYLIPCFCTLMNFMIFRHMSKNLANRNFDFSHWYRFRMFRTFGISCASSTRPFIFWPAKILREFEFTESWRYRSCGITR